MSEEYVSSKPTYVDFIEGSEVDTTLGKEDIIQWIGPWIYCRELGGQEQCKQNNSQSSFVDDLMYKEDYYRASKLTVTYRHKVQNINTPTVPSLKTPSNFALETSIINYNWDKSSGGGNIVYQLQVDTDSNFSTPLFSNTTTSSTSKSITNHSPGVIYYWRVRASNSAGASNWSNTRNLAVRPGTPVVTATIYNGHPKLTWPSAAGATSYDIYKKTDVSTDWMIYSSTSTNSYVDLMADVSGYQGIAYDGFGDPFVAYYIVAKGVNNIQSFDSESHYFDLEGITPFSTDF